MRFSLCVCCGGGLSKIEDGFCAIGLFCCEINLYVFGFSILVRKVVSFCLVCKVVVGVTWCDNLYFFLGHSCFSLSALLLGPSSSRVFMLAVLSSPSCSPFFSIVNKIPNFLRKKEHIYTPFYLLLNVLFGYNICNIF